MNVLQRTFSTHLSREALAAQIRRSELSLNVDGVRIRAALMSLTCDVVRTPESPTTPVEVNLAGFVSTEESADEIGVLELVGDVPPVDSEERQAFFRNLQRMSLEVVCFSDVFIEGRLQEIVTCRNLPDAETAPIPPPPKPAPEPLSAAGPEVSVAVSVTPIAFEEVPVAVAVGPLAPAPSPLPPPTPPAPAAESVVVVSAEIAASVGAAAEETIPVAVFVAAPVSTPAVVSVAVVSEPPPVSPAPGIDSSSLPDAAVAISSAPMALISQPAFELIREFEGIDQPSLWPGGSSGISLGVGYDLGTVSLHEFQTDWADELSTAHLSRLSTAIGLLGAPARALAGRFRDIRVAPEPSARVFTHRTLPVFRTLTLRTFPGMEHLPADAQGALVSLVYNRGASLRGERRREMRAIAELLARAGQNGDLHHGQRPLLHAIADQFVAMKRLWLGAGVDGLLARRDAEAALIRRSA